MIFLGRAITAYPAQCAGSEWLVTNGLGGFASGTVAGALTRRYHGMLVTAGRPPLGRIVRFSKVDETLTYDGLISEIYSNQWQSAAAPLIPNGYEQIDYFYLDGTTPVWIYSLADALIEKRIWMEQGADTTYVQYTLLRGRLPLELTIKLFATHRDMHINTRAVDGVFRVEPHSDGMAVRAHESESFVFGAGATFEPHSIWYRDYFLAREADRGLDAVGDHLLIGLARARVAPGESFGLVFTADAAADRDVRAARQRRATYERSLIANAQIADADELITHLILAADQFIVRRPNDADPDGRTILAGYHWFSDWGRDTMIALPGLTIATRRFDDAASILRTFARYVDQGMLPNRFPDDGQQPEYNTVDATLWYFEAIRAYHAASGDETLVRDLYPLLASIIDWHLRGTRYGIGVDPADGLLRSGEPGAQLTWMDVKIGDHVVTPRTGKAVEINALWYNALRIMVDFAPLVEADPAPYQIAAERVAVGFDRFWDADRGFCLDVIDAPDGSSDATLRPNQLIAASLHHTPLPIERIRAIVDVCARDLITPYGVRTLSPRDKRYAGHYDGTPEERDLRYHQGTAWAWLIGSFVGAHLRAYGDPARARSFLAPFGPHLRQGGIGSIAEICDGDAPYAPVGCIAQAWSVGEVLRAWLLTSPTA